MSNSKAQPDNVDGSGSSDCYAETTLICAVCGYQWDQECKLVKAFSGPKCKGKMVPSTFYEECPVCESNMVHQYAPEAVDKDGGDVPWY